LGYALLLAAIGLIGKAYMTMACRRRACGTGHAPGDVTAIVVRPVPTVVVA
jgi:hypothetical protein